ncbi:MAG: hypothetical protein HYX24_02720 [Candidatus Aenigmarchaeota archaeon]|nr:hypothetical protein [Candidatus Aenigmarchaeota archaeon]
MPPSCRHLILLIMPVILISGCLDSGVCVPGLTACETQYTDDVIVIKSLEAIPSEIAPEQTTKIIAYVENRLNAPVKGIHVELFDYCPGLLNLEGSASQGPYDLLGKEVKEASWTLKAQDTVRLETTCPKDGVKIRVLYPYKTSSRTTISFIDENEYQRRLEEGRFRKQASDVVLGEGPLKPRVIVDDVQPVPAGIGNTILTFNIKNSGQGFPKDTAIPVKGNIKIESSDGNGLATALYTCISKEGEEERIIKFIQKETPNFACAIKVPEAQGRIEFTEFITVTLDYIYEFRSSVIVKVKPKM